MSWFKQIFSREVGGSTTHLEPIVKQINDLESAIKALSNDELKAKTTYFKSQLLEGKILDDILPEAFACVREASRRTLGQRHFDVQLLAGVVLHRGGIAEMKTGEGKTLMATLPVYLNALQGEGVHVVTVNDYLARRDAVWMGQIYDALGLSVGIINHQSSYLYDAAHQEVDTERDQKGAFHVVDKFLKPVTRREAYAADITYGTNNEFGFDYLRDHLSYKPEQVAQNIGGANTRYAYAIVDEVDSVLIDEARTPLIISAPVAESDSLYKTFAKIGAQLEAPADYTIDEKMKAVSLTEEGISKAEKLLGIDNIYTERGVVYVHQLETAARAKALFIRDREYVVKDGEIIIVDEFTGRLQPGRRWSDGLHQAVEAKEGVAVKQETRTYGSITLQNYFKLYRKLAGMTGTALTSAEEFRKVYGLDVVVVPTNRTSARKDLTDQIFITDQGKLQAISRKIKELHQRGQPVLVGTVSIDKNEQVAAYLSREGVPHRLLNAKNNEQEGEIIAQAGRKGSVVIATNLAGRGVDIKLGGALATPEEYEEVKALGGLFVLGTERHEARRIDNQLRGRSGRQGDPGTTQFFISLDDQLARVFASDKIKAMIKRMGMPEDQPIENRLVAKAIESAQAKIEGMNFDVRKHLLEYDNVLNHQRTIVYTRRQKILFGDADLLLAELTDATTSALPAGRQVFPDDEDEQKTFLAKVGNQKTEWGEEVWQGTVRQILLQSIDLFWLEHLEGMDYLKNSVRLRAYGQRDPLVEYQKEGLLLYRTLKSKIDIQAVDMLSHLEKAPTFTPKESVKVVPSEVEGLKVSRNDPCPCGSGKKYKKCHGQ